jgi:tetraacyldisaccharide 4'-kinase
MTGARRLLLPLTPLYRLGLGLREMRLRRGWETVRRLRYPVISIGNLSTGGAGKTPLAIALAKALTARGFAVDVLSRGYGRSSRDAVRVKLNGTAEEFGDEPLLIAREAGVPVYVARERFEAGVLAEAELRAEGEESNRPIVHLLDDGFQHRQLARDVDVLLLSGADWRDRLLPAGNLREPLRSAMRAGIVAIPAEEAEIETALRRWGWEGSVWRLRRRMEAPANDGPVAAFCGIARPDQFFEGLRNAGLQVATRMAFPDHHRYVQHDVDCVVGAARTVGATVIVTTEKDRVRLGKLIAAFPESARLVTARLRIEFEEETASVDSLVRLLKC